MSKKYTDEEERGLVDLFGSNEANKLILQAIARTISKLKELNPKESLDIVLMHSQSVHSILNRKAITREVLFKYLHEKRVPVCENYTKLLLIERIIEYWNGNKPVKIEASSPDHFPINLMSQQFSDWFFRNLNQDDLKAADFWVDCSTNVRIKGGEAPQDLQDYSAEGNSGSLEVLLSLRRNLGVKFQPNLCYEGVQGRIDPHGLVVLMCCGTVHKAETYVGVFETAFGLIKNPDTDGNWRIRYLKMWIRSAAGGGNALPPRLSDSETLQSILALPETSSST